jgi:predicted XRE-type DNA-binding protein
MRRHQDYRITTDNIFQDLLLPNAEELNVKTGLAIELGQLIRKRGLTQTQAAAALGIDQPRVSALLRGHLEKFSMEKLCDLLRAMGCDVAIRIQEPKRTKQATGRLTGSVA